MKDTAFNCCSDKFSRVNRIIFLGHVFWSQTHWSQCNSFGCSLSEFLVFRKKLLLAKLWQQTGCINNRKCSHQIYLRPQWCLGTRQHVSAVIDQWISLFFLKQSAWGKQDSFLCIYLCLQCTSTYSICLHVGFVRYAVLTLGLVDGVLKTLLILKVMHTRNSSLTDPRHFGKLKYLQQQLPLNNKQ